ncbi:hypothetical protein ANO11243_039480 [Dothideomycetidae sp. 11243]|nr:hypothetical protein ANO11243_039480 [fungal sp. No.11243]
MAPVPQTHTQRLLSLDKTFDSLDDRIESAAGILQISLEDESAVHEIGNHGRHDLVLHWIQDKLKKEPAARADPKAWRLFRRLVALLPASRVSKFLEETEATTTVILALAEQFPISENQSPPPDSELSTTTKTKKRKRQDAPDQEEFPLVRRCQVFLELSFLLRRTKLPCSGQTVVELTRNIILALISLSTQVKGQKSSHDERFFFVELVSLIERWKTVTRPLVTAKVLNSFASAVALPALKLICRLHSLHFEEAELLLQGFITKEFFSLSHSTFVRSALSGSSKDILKDDIETVFGPVTNQMFPPPDKSKSSYFLENDEAICDILSIIFRECYRLKEHHTPKEKRAHAKWIECLFKTFLSAIGSACADRPRRKNLIMSMLNNVERDGEALAGTNLENVIIEYSDLVSISKDSVPDTQSADFGVISRVLTLDPSIFEAYHKQEKLSLKVLLDNINIGSSQTELTATEQVGLWVQKLAIPLINAQAQRQRAEKFFEVWTTSMMVYTHESAGCWRLWQQPDVRDCFSQLIDTSLERASVQRLLERAIDQLQESLDKISKVAATQKDPVSISLLTLSIVVDSIRSDEIVDNLSGTFRRLLKLLIKSFTTMKDHNVFRTHLWELLFHLQERLVPDYDSTGGAAFLDEILGEQGPCLEDAVHYITQNQSTDSTPTANTSAALTYVIQTWSLSLSVQDPPKWTQGQLMNKVLTSANRSPSLYANALCQFPEMCDVGKTESDSRAVRADLLGLLLKGPLSQQAETLFLHLFKLSLPRGGAKMSMERDKVLSQAFLGAQSAGSWALKLLTHPESDQFLDRHCRSFLLRMATMSFSNGIPNVDMQRTISSAEAVLGLLGDLDEEDYGWSKDATDDNSTLAPFSVLKMIAEVLDNDAKSSSINHILAFDRACLSLMPSAIMKIIDLGQDPKQSMMIVYAEKHLQEFEQQSSHSVQSVLAWWSMIWLQDHDLMKHVNSTIIAAAGESISKICKAQRSAADAQLGCCIQALVLIPDSCWDTAGPATTKAIKQAKLHCIEAITLSENLGLWESFGLGTSQSSNQFVNLALDRVLDRLKNASVPGSRPTTEESALLDAKALLAKGC